MMNGMVKEKHPGEDRTGIMARKVAIAVASALVYVICSSASACIFVTHGGGSREDESFLALLGIMAAAIIAMLLLEILRRRVIALDCWGFFMSGILSGVLLSVPASSWIAIALLPVRGDAFEIGMTGLLCFVLMELLVTCCCMRRPDDGPCGVQREKGDADGVTGEPGTHVREALSTVGGRVRR